MTVLVTGGAGFIGSHLVIRLAAMGRRVVAVDNLHRGKRANLRETPGSGSVLFEEGDIRDDRVIARLSGQGPYEAVYHLAALHFIPECVAHPTGTLSVNVVGTQALLDAVHCTRFVFASTADVYAPKEGAHRESDPLGPFNVYGLSKLFGEHLVQAAIRTSMETSYVVARLFNVYGPRETNPHLIPQLLEQARRGDTIRVGNLWPRRDYTYVADTVEALLALEKQESPPTFDVFNVGTGTALSVEEVVAELGEVLGAELRTTVEEARARTVERAHLQANNSKIDHAVGWRPRYSLRQGLALLCQAEGLIQ